MVTTGIRDMGIMEIMVTAIKDMVAMEAMITQVTTIIMDILTTTVSICGYIDTCIAVAKVTRCDGRLWLLQISLVDMGSHHGVVATPTVTNRIKGTNPPPPRRYVPPTTY